MTCTKCPHCGKDPTRGTGKTTRFLLEALLRACNGEKVLFLARNQDEAHRLWARAAQIMECNTPVCTRDEIVMQGGGFVKFRSAAADYACAGMSSCGHVIVDTR